MKIGLVRVRIHVYYLFKGTRPRSRLSNYLFKNELLCTDNFIINYFF